MYLNNRSSPPPPLPPLFFLLFLFRFRKEKKQRRPLRGGGNQSLHWLSPCLHRLMCLCSRPQSPAFQLSWCLRGCLLAASHSAQPRKAAPCPPRFYQGPKPFFPQDTVPAEAGLSKTSSSLPFPLEEWQSKHLIIISGHFFSPYYSPFTVQKHCQGGRREMSLHHLMICKGNFCFG